MSRTVGETLRQARVSKDLGLREFAKKLHLNPQALGNIEHNHSLPSDTILAKAADYLGLDFSTLAHQRDNPPSLNPVYSIRFGPCIIHSTKCAAEARVWHSTKGPLFKNDGSTLGEELEKMPREPGCGTCNICKNRENLPRVRYPVPTRRRHQLLQGLRHLDLHDLQRLPRHPHRSSTAAKNQQTTRFAANSARPERKSHPYH